MDRTMIAPWRAEEKEHSEKLFKKLQGLSLIYPMNDEMKKLLAWDMFLKPNQPAFFQVMHYLFCILDPAEFKRRFFWPISDKKLEANFRRSTIDYLNYLNAKHNLNWANIKSYLVVMPGGMKFINFLLDLVALVIQELTKQREKALAADIDISKYRNWNPKRMAIANASYKEYVSEYIEEMEKNSALFREGTERIRQKQAEIARATGISRDLLLDNGFLLGLDKHNLQKIERQMLLPAANIATLEASLDALKDNVDQFQAKQTHYKQMKETADGAVRNIYKLFGTVADCGTGNGVNVNGLLSAFNEISDTIAEQLDANDQYNESNGFIGEGLEELRAELQQIDVQVSDVQRSLNECAKEQSANISGNTSQPAEGQLTTPVTPMRTLDAKTHIDIAGHPLLMKFVSTPPIKPDLASSARNLHVRLPLQDDFNAMQFDTTCNSRLATTVLRSARKAKTEQSVDCNTTVNRSKIMDPMQLLRTINKSTNANTLANLSSLGSKWKEMQATFGFDDAASASEPASPSPRASTSRSPFTPLSCNDHTRIERMAMAKTDPNNSSLFAMKSAAVMKVLDASLNVRNLSTSPSGRLDALVVAGPQALPRIQLNDYTLSDGEQLHSSQEENDANTLNIQPGKFNLVISGCEDDDLLNISDSVIKDIVI